MTIQYGVKGCTKLLVLVSFFMCAFNVSAEECKAEGATLTVSEEYLWLLKGRKDITEEQYSEAYELHSKFKFEYENCERSTSDKQLHDLPRTRN